jgi:pimeloyl-ACP methyl ester carboxylesterase
MPHVGEPGRLLAPDLIGMGQSRKPEIAYRFEDQARYLEAWFDGLALDGVVLIGHDWGEALALDWAARHPRRVRGIGRRYFSAAWHLITQHLRGGLPFRVKRWAGRAPCLGQGWPELDRAGARS